MNDLNITISETAAKIILNTIEDQSVSDPYLAFYVAGGKWKFIFKLRFTAASDFL